MKPYTIFIFLILITFSASGQRFGSSQISDITVVASKDGTILGSITKNERLLLGQRMSLPYSFPDSSTAYAARKGDRIKRINYLVGMQVGMIVRDKPKAQSYSKLRVGLSAGSYKINNIGGVSNQITYGIDTVASSIDSSLIYIDSNQSHSILFDQKGINIRLSLDFLVYLKTRSQLSGYVGLGAAFNQTFSNNLTAQYRGASYIGPNPYVDGVRSGSGGLDVLAESNYELKSNSQLNLHLLLGVQGRLSKDGSLSLFIEFQPGLSANFQQEYQNRIGTNWMSQVGVLYSFKRKKLKDPDNI